MGAVGMIDSSIINQLKNSFESKCIDLLEWACCQLKASKTINADWGEENITANIFKLIYECPQSIQDNIYPECEHPLFDQNILENKKKAKKAPRIDLVFQYNWSGRRFSFYVEAKNLIENNVKKTGRKTITKSSVVLKRYINTGIDHYLLGYYPQGCILGYILNGTIVGVVNVLNLELIHCGRSSEVLCYSSGVAPWVSYQSQHNVQGLNIFHYFFDFT